MKVRPSLLEGVAFIDFLRSQDDRGCFVKTFHADVLQQAGLPSVFRESFYSISRKNVIRGMHFQAPPADHAKLIFVTQGEILDVALDIRKTSPTYGMFATACLSAATNQAIFIEPGFAHGFAALQDNTMVMYLQTSVYDPDLDSGIHPLSCGIDWGIATPILSVRDVQLPPFRSFDTPFS
jgi:dTDP-4-dehydrorhamnose 3,5-epimerase